MYNINGALVKTIARGEAPAGRIITHDLEPGKLSKGTYILKLVTDSEVLVERIIVQ
jgi:hypothetical protein